MIPAMALAAAPSPGVPNYIAPMVATESQHDTGAKVLLNGVELPARQNAARDLNDAIDNGSHLGTDFRTESCDFFRLKDSIAATGDRKSQKTSFVHLGIILTGVGRDYTWQQINSSQARRSFNHQMR
jgi:hypothetical protein